MLATEDRTGVRITDSPFMSSLLGRTRWLGRWFIIRAYLGHTWLPSASEKIGNPAWAETGAVVRGSRKRATMTAPQRATRRSKVYTR